MDFPKVCRFDPENSHVMLCCSQYRTFYFIAFQIAFSQACKDMWQFRGLIEMETI